MQCLDLQLVFKGKLQEFKVSENVATCLVEAIALKIDLAECNSPPLHIAQRILYDVSQRNQLCNV